MNELETRLRHQANQFTPAPPDEIHQRVMSTIDDVSMAPRSSSTVRRAVSLAFITILLTSGIILINRRERQIASQDQPPPRALRRISFPVSTPAALMQRYVNHPLESEMKSLSRCVSDVAGTISGLLPAPATETAPQT